MSYRTCSLLHAYHLLGVPHRGVRGLARVVWMLQAMSASSARDVPAERHGVHGENIALGDSLSFLVGEPWYSPAIPASQPERPRPASEVHVSGLAPCAAGKASDEDVNEALQEQTSQRMKSVRILQVPRSVN